MKRDYDNAPFVLEGQTAEFQHCVDKTGLSREERVRLPRRENFIYVHGFESFLVTTSTLSQIKGSQTKGGTKLDRICFGTKLPLLRESQPQLLL